MMSLWLLLKGSKIVQFILAIAGAFLGILVYGKSKKREGKRENQQKAKEIDYERADEIDDRVRDTRDELRVRDRKLSDLRYRD